MKNSFWLIALLMVVAMSFVSLTACSSGDDDDDDDNEADDDTFGDDDTYADDDTFSDDDTITDDDTTDDDDDDDDDDAPRLTAATLYIGAPDFPDMMGEGGGKIGIYELGFIDMSYTDSPSCDLKGGYMWYSLDEGDPVKYEQISNAAGCSTQQYALYGYDLNQIDGALEPWGDDLHQMEMWWVDASGNESNHLKFFYKVDDYPTAHGKVMEDWILTDQDGNEVSLSDFEGEIVVIEGFTGWCTYCGMQANEMDNLQIQYDTDGDPVQLLGMMMETSSGSTDITEQILTDYRTAHGWDVAGIPNLADPGGALLKDYYLGGGVPFNMILDTDHVIRLKWHGYGSGLVGSLVGDLLAELE